MFKKNEKAISQIAEYIPRACRGMQLHEAKARLEKKIALYTDDGNDSNLLIVFYVQIMPDDFVMQLHRF
ncbi:hypothetical protein [Klebsiella pneumoniae]|uniref:hypothetical protein n=1 Tax=Klebsiella pneumoniae TaxID=573 RepID=UPI0029CA564F|nr:hypothetical protein [Klebsiella pneumoniae]WPI30040.1 hypothetical protein R8542_14850 [Klebsiella pneumoniae]